MKMHWTKTICLCYFARAVSTCTFIQYLVCCLSFGTADMIFFVNVLLRPNGTLQLTHGFYSRFKLRPPKMRIHKKIWMPRIVANSGSLQWHVHLLLWSMLLRFPGGCCCRPWLHLGTVSPLPVSINSIWASQLLLWG